MKTSRAILADAKAADCFCAIERCLGGHRLIIERTEEEIARAPRLRSLTELVRRHGLWIA